MSGVYIKGMEMPKHWRDCMFSNGAAQCCLLNMESCGNGIPCPLIPVPDHGRLIEAERLKVVFHRNVVSGDAFDQLIDIAPTIIPADKEGEN